MTSTTIPLSPTAWTDLGAGPMLLTASGGALAWVAADSGTTIPLATAGNGLPSGTPPVLIQTTQHVYALALTPTYGTGSAIVTPVTAWGGSGGGSGGIVTQGALDATAAPWKSALYQGGALVAAANGLYVQPGTGATFAVTGTFWQTTQPVSATALPLPAGAATSALQTAMTTALGSPFQAGGSIGNTAFGISGTLPAFAATPTVNVGTLPALVSGSAVIGSVKSTDGTNTAAVKAASTAAALADPALVVAQSPNSAAAHMLGTQAFAAAQVSSIATTGSTATTLVASRTGIAGTGRVAVTIVNTGSTTIYIGATNGVTASGGAGGASIAPGASRTLEMQAAVYGVIASGTGSCDVIELY